MNVVKDEGKAPNVISHFRVGEFDGSEEDIPARGAH